MPFDSMPDDVQADYERLSFDGQTPAVLLGGPSDPHSAEQLAKVQEARQGIGLAPLSPFEAYSFQHGTQGGGQGPGSHHARDDADFAFDAPGGHAGNWTETARSSEYKGPGTSGFAFDGPSSAAAGSTTVLAGNSSGVTAPNFALVDHGLRRAPAQLVDVFREMQQPDDQGKTNTALVIDLWCLLESGAPGTPITTGTRKMWGRVNFPCKLISSTLLADPAGNVTLDVLRTDYATFPTFTSIVAAAPPTISAGQKAFDDTLTGWTVLLSRGDLIRIDVTVNSAADLMLIDLAAVRTDASDKTNS